MADARDPLAGFDADIVEAVAADRGTPVDRVREVLRRHQERTREFPGVDELVYEWRTRLADDPFVARTETAYVLAVRASVWEEFGEQMGLSDDSVAVLREVHDRQARREAGEDDPFEGAAPMLLVRP